MTDTHPDPAREIVADIFDRASALAFARVGDFPPDVAAGLAIGAALAKVISTLVRTLGVDDAKALVDGLVEHRNDGVIAPDDMRADDASIAGAVADMYKRGVPAPKPIVDDAFDDVTPPDPSKVKT